MKIVIVSPHRDDAAFSLTLSVAAWLEAGHQVHVLNCFTQSAYAPFSDAESLHANDRVSFVSAIRKREDEAWHKVMGGRVRWTDLDLLDAPLRLACAVDEVLAVEIRPGDRAVARVAGALRKIADSARAGEVAFALPAAIGGHIDHRVVRAAGELMMREQFLPVALYEDLPYAAWIGDHGGDRAGVEEAVRNPAEEFAPVFMEDVAAEPAQRVTLKRRAAECYDSQIDSSTAGLISDFCLGYGGRERLWANAAWQGTARLHPGTPEASA